MVCGSSRGQIPLQGETSIYDARTTPARLRRAVPLDGMVTVVVPSKFRSDSDPVRALRVAVGRGRIGMATRPSFGAHAQY